MSRATAWCRADFAGGTLDIWPLGLLHRGARTVNVALELPVRVEMERRSSAYRVEQDGACTEAGDVAELARSAGAGLVAEVVRWLELPPCRVVISSASPRGAGLGASSALTVALLAAGERLLGRDGEATIEGRAAVARDLEARLMRLPTGQQDHFPALLGGVLEIEHLPGGERVSRLAVDLPALAERLVIAYTGQSHFSAGANWQVVRRCLDGDPELFRRLGAIRDVALELVGALREASWPEVGSLMRREWRERRELAPEIPTPAIGRLLDVAESNGAWGGKACGAGGGGSIAVLVPPEARAGVEKAWRAEGAQVLAAARPTARSLEVED